MSRYRTPYHEEDDLDISSRRTYQAPSRAGLVALFAALTSVGLLVIIAILAVLANHVGNLEGSGLLVVVIILLNIVAFAASIVGLVQGIRSQAAGNTEYRGHGLTGLIGSILALLVALGVFLVSFCVGLMIAAVQNVPGG